MTYFTKNAELKQGYNTYIDTAADDMGTQMDVGLLLMEAGDVFVIDEAEKEVAVLLFSGKVTYEWDGKTVEADRPDSFHYEAYCLREAHTEDFVTVLKPYIEENDEAQALIEKYLDITL